MFARISAKLTQMRFNYKQNQERKLFNRFVTIYPDRINKPAYDQIMAAQKGMANFVMKKNVGVDIYDAQEAVTSGFAVKPHKNETLQNKLLVKVTNLLTGMIDEKLISADTKAISKHESYGFCVFDIPQDGLQYTRKTKKSTEDSFLRNLYRNIEEMTEKVTK